MLHLPPIPFTPPMYRSVPAGKGALAWYRPQSAEFGQRWRKLFADAKAAVQNGAEQDEAAAAQLDTGIRALFAEAVEAVEIAGTPHAPGEVDLPPQFIAQVVAGIANGSYDDSYPKS